MIKVTELGYLGLNVSDAKAWRAYAAECVGFEVLDEGEADRFYLRMDNWHHRFVMHVGQQDDLAYMGWRVADAESLQKMEQQLQEARVPYCVGTSEEAAERHVLGLLKLHDPSGIPTEIFYGPRVDMHLPFHPGRRMHGRFLTGDQGLGHCLIQSKDPVASYRFYGLLGLTGSVEYHLQTPVGVAKPIFMHCNDRQHSVAFGIPSEKMLNHMMLEYADLNDLGMAHDIVRKGGIPVALQLGKHSNDQALTFYSATPSGWLMELGWGACKSSAQQQYHVLDVFGHGMEAAGMGLDLKL
ncbi:MAG: VOC family protein [Panacagrimonas sp.]